MVSMEEVEKDLELHDPLDLVLVLAIGPSPASHLKVQKRAILISSVLGVNPEAEPYDYGLYSETITEKLLDAKNATLFRRREDGQYELTSMGRRAYELLMERLNTRSKENISSFIRVLHDMSEEELLALTYHLFPTSFKESKIKGRVLAIINRFKEKGLVRAKKEGEKIVIEVEFR
jgi:hypothetical protein